MKTEKQYQPFSEIPSALLWEILGRASIKTCLTCKRVCKQWYRIVNHPEFSSFRRNCKPSRFMILFHDNSSAGRGFNFDLVELEKALGVDDSGNLSVCVNDLIRFKPRLNPPSTIWCVKSHCNGVVCFVNERSNFFICHLLTGQSVNFENQLWNRYLYVSGCELGCCPVSGQFKLLLLLWDKTNKIQMAMIATILTLGDGEWRRVGNAPMKIRMDGCFLNGSTHWLDRNSICSFHFGKEEFLPVSLPDDISVGSYKKTNRILSIFDSCLCLGCFPEGVGVEIDIWMMKRYGVKGSWARQFVIVSDAWSAPLMHMDMGKILVSCGYRLCLYDPQTKVFKRVNLELNGPLSSVVLPVGFDLRFSSF